MFISRKRTIQATTEANDEFWNEALRVGKNTDGFLMYFMGGEI
jgi:hypothetical protein